MLIHDHLSSSRGNLFHVDDGSTRLVLECGVSFAKLQQALDYRTMEFDGCLISHEHMDHARCARMLSERGLPLYASSGTLRRCDVYGVILEPHKPVQIKTLTVMGFPVRHDAAEPMGFLIYSHKTKEKSVFLIDTHTCEFSFRDVTQVCIECNYKESLLMESDRLPDATKERIRASHMSLEDCLALLAKCDLSRTEQIMLMHLSHDRSDAAAFRRAVQEQTGIQNVRIAGG